MEIWSFGFDFLIFWLFILTVVYFALKNFYIFFGGKIFLKSRLRQYGEWAVVTGCTGGLGQEFCHQIAEIGINIILIDKCNESVLSKLAKDLERQHTVKTLCIVSDFRDNRQENYQRIFELTDKLDVGILINNAGVLYDCPSYFHEITDQKLRDLIDINILPPMVLSYHFIKAKMLQKKKGLIVFMGSYSGVIPQPFIAGYSASKGFINFLVKALALEYGDHGIFVQGLCPAFIATGMNHYSNFLTTPSIICPSPKRYVRRALPTFGMVHFTTGYLLFEIMDHFLSIVPEWLKLAGSKIILRLIIYEAKSKK